MSEPSHTIIGTKVDPPAAMTPDGIASDHSTAHVTVQPKSSRAELKPGDRFGDFFLLRELGAGSFATVYLAHDVTLGRRVALKVSEIRGLGEGKALAELEHEHIVRVHAQFSDLDTGKHCLCLQFVPGTTLARVIERLFRDGRHPISGQEILDAITFESKDEVAFDPAGLRQRQILSRCDYAAAVCRVGQQLAEALYFAHRHGILHCDVKPANVLINPYGWPLLADFNVSIEGQRVTSKNVGGTILYMAPEQLSLFLQEPTSAVNELSDEYSLGLVLVELLIGRPPFLPPVDFDGDPRRELLRRQQESDLDQALKNDVIPLVLQRVLRRSLAPNPADRYPDAAAFGTALSNAFDLISIDKLLPKGGRLSRLILQWPFALLITMTLLPQLVGSVVNLTYNTLHIHLDPEQVVAFSHVTLVYNLVVYPVAVVVMYRILMAFYRGWRRLEQPPPPTGAEIDDVRRQALSLGHWGIFLALAGWLPGGILFPLAIHLYSSALPWETYAHFVVSFTLSGLIAVIYAHFGIQFVVLRVFYPRLGNPDGARAHIAIEELRAASRWLAPFQSLAAVVPLAGAVLLIAVGGEMTLAYRLLIMSLILLGMAGVGIAVVVSQHLREIIRIHGGAREETLP